jgi:hypothetical protein
LDIGMDLNRFKIAYDIVVVPGKEDWIVFLFLEKTALNS